MQEFTIIYERGETSWGAYVPDLPGCVAVGETRAEVEEGIQNALRMHLEALRTQGQSAPRPAHWAQTVWMPVPA